MNSPEANMHATQAQDPQQWIVELFQKIDRKDAEGFAAFVAPDGTFTYANNPPVKGRAEIARSVSGFFGAIRGLRHDLQSVQTVRNGLVIEGRVTYDRHDGTQVSYPFCNVFELEGGLVKRYAIYVDASTLFAPAPS
jgi:ketosteroid isomerase-like protein